MKTVFLDRDGVINRKQPEGDYVKNWGEFDFLPGAVDALKLLSKRGFRLIIVTNQRGIARGLMTEADLQDIHRRMVTELTSNSVKISAIYTCPHDAGQCTCRKPQTGLFLQAQRDFPDIVWEDCVMVGDSLSDITAGYRIGCRSILIAGKDIQSRLVLSAQESGIGVEAVAESLFEAAAACFVLQ